MGRLHLPSPFVYDLPEPRPHSIVELWYEPDVKNKNKSERYLMFCKDEAGKVYIHKQGPMRSAMVRDMLVFIEYDKRMRIDLNYWRHLPRKNGGP